MKEKITRTKLSDIREDLTDWKRVNALTDADIAKAIAEDPDTEEATPEMWTQAVVWHPARDKEPITVRLDSDMLTWFRRQGRGYQTRINAVLRAYYEAHRRGHSSS